MGATASDSIFEQPIFTMLLDDLEEMFSEDLGSAKVAAAHADKPKGIPESILAKL